MNLPLLEIALVPVRLDQVASGIVNADHRIFVTFAPKIRRTLMKGKHKEITRGSRAN